MKRVLFFLIASLLIVGCSQYEFEQSDSGITVKESVLEFDAKGGDGFIVVSATSAFEAKSNSEWCTIKVEGDKIGVKVMPHIGNQNRTAVVTISTGKGYPVNVPVTQVASLFIIKELQLEVDFLKSTVKVPVVSGEKVTVSTEDDWIEASVSNDSVVITVAENMDEEIRTGKVKVVSGAVTQTIEVEQVARRLSFEEFLGNWTLSSINSIKGEKQPTTREVQLTVHEKGKSYRLAPIPNKLDNSAVMGELLIDYSVVEGKSILKMRNAQSLPGSGKYAVKAVFWNAGNLFNSSSSIVYQGVYKNDENTISIHFEDNGSWKDQKVNGLLFSLFNEKNEYKGATYSMDYVILTKKK